MKKVMAIDPSGSFKEGKGTTGMSIVDTNYKIIDTADVPAKEYATAQEYYQGVCTDIQLGWDCHSVDHVVIEDYMLYATKAKSQINSRMETSQLIGVMKQYCFDHNIPYTMQPASLVKKRWANKILVYKGIIKSEKHSGYSRHELDSIRHAVHYITFVLNKKEVTKC